MPGIDGIKATTRIIAQKFAQTKVIVFGSHDEDRYVDRVLNAGAKGYLLKTTPLEELAYSIRFVHKGYLQFSPELLEKFTQARQLPLRLERLHQSSSEIVLASPSQIQPHDWSSQTRN